MICIQVCDFFFFSFFFWFLLPLWKLAFILPFLFTENVSLSTSRIALIQTLHLSLYSADPFDIYFPTQALQGGARGSHASSRTFHGREPPTSRSLRRLRLLSELPLHRGESQKTFHPLNFSSLAPPTSSFPLGPRLFRTPARDLSLSPKCVSAQFLAFQTLFL